ncbi:UDP-glucose 4-epimerase [Balamuthia mandrillaris]
MVLARHCWQYTYIVFVGLFFLWTAWLVNELLSFKEQENRSERALHALFYPPSQHRAQNSLGFDLPSSFDAAEEEEEAAAENESEERTREPLYSTLAKSLIRPMEAQSLSAPIVDAIRQQDGQYVRAVMKGIAGGLLYGPIDPQKPLILVTGGAGFIGSHTCIVLLEAGYGVVVIDNFDNSNEESLRRVQEITQQSLLFYRADLRNEIVLNAIFEKHKFAGVIHFAGLKAVGESVRLPLHYYDTNVGSTITLLKVMERHGVKKLVFSSSSTVYGNPEHVPITEDSRLHPESPYGRTKYFIELMLRDWAKATNTSIVMLRYFNPIGAHPSGRIGEDPRGIPNNLMPFICQVLVGKLPELHVFGTDWPTKDGTGVRDYIHVMDVANGHTAALEKLFHQASNNNSYSILAYNLGTGKGVSVMEMVNAMSKATGREIPVVFDPRRPGDIAECYADPSLAERELGWKAELSVEDMCKDSWRWQSLNPSGYASDPSFASAVKAQEERRGDAQKEGREEITTAEPTRRMENVSAPAMSSPASAFSFHSTATTTELNEEQKEQQQGAKPEPVEQPRQQEQAIQQQYVNNNNTNNHLTHENGTTSTNNNTTQAPPSLSAKNSTAPSPSPSSSASSPSSAVPKNATTDNNNTTTSTTPQKEQVLLTLNEAKPTTTTTTSIYPNSTLPQVPTSSVNGLPTSTASSSSSSASAPTKQKKNGEKQKKEASKGKKDKSKQKESGGKKKSKSKSSL